MLLLISENTFLLLRFLFFFVIGVLSDVYPLYISVISISKLIMNSVPKWSAKKHWRVNGYLLC